MTRNTKKKKKTRSNKKRNFDGMFKRVMTLNVQQKDTNQLIRKTNVFFYLHGSQWSLS